MVFTWAMCHSNSTRPSNNSESSKLHCTPLLRCVPPRARRSAWLTAEGLPPRVIWSDYGDCRRLHHFNQHRYPVCVFGLYRSDNVEQLPVLVNDHDRSRWRYKLAVSAGAAGRDINGA